MDVERKFEELLDLLDVDRDRFWVRLDRTTIQLIDNGYEWRDQERPTIVWAMEGEGK